MSNKLYNLSKRQYEYVPDEAFGEALRSGQYKVPVGSKVKIFTDDNEEFEGDANSDFTQLGPARIETFTQAKQRELQEKYKDSELAAAGLGAARGATFGLSDAVGKGLGFGEDIAAIKEANPISSTVGEVGGVIGSSVLLPGGGLTGLAAKAGAGVTERVGAKLGVDVTEKLLEKGFGDVTSELVKRAAARGAGSAIEAAAYGVGQTVSEAALGDPDKAAQHLLGNVGLNALFGGGAASALGIGSDLVRGPLKDMVRGGIESGTKKYIDVVAKIKGGDADTLKKVYADRLFKEGSEEAAGRSVYLDYVANPDQATSQFVSHIDDLNQTGKKMAGALIGDAREANIGALKGISFKEAAQDAKDKVLSSSQEALNRMNIKEDKILFDRGFSRILEKETKDLEKNINKIYLDGGDAKDVYNATLNFRKEVDKHAKSFFKKNTDMMTPQQMKSKLEWEELRSKVNDHLRSPNLYGGTAIANKELDQAYSKFATSWDNYKKHFLVSEQTTGGKTYNVSGSKVNSFFRDETKIGKVNAAKALDSYTDSLQDLIEKSNKYGLVDGDVAEQLTKSFSKIRDERKLAREAMNALNVVQSYTGASLKLTTAGYMLGSILPVPGASGALGAVGSLLDNPMYVLNGLARLERVVLNNKDKINSGVVRFLQGRPGSDIARGGAALTRAGTLSSVSQFISSKLQAPNPDAGEAFKIDEDNYHTIFADLQNSVNNPMMVAEKVHQSLGQIGDLAPNVAQMTTVNALNAANFLYQKMPKPRSTAAGIFPTKNHYKPSKAELSKFKRYVSSVNNPMVIVDQLKDGVISPETAEVLQQVYPQLLGDIQNAFMEKLIEKDSDIDYNKKLQLSKLFNTPTLEAMQPEFLTLLQSNMQAQEVVNQKEPGKMNLANQVMTPFDKSINRT